MEYREALAALASASQPGMRLGLDSTRALLAGLGNPEQGLQGVLVGGTNGKGSVCAMAAEIARQAGHRVALLTKPHLTSYRERIQLGPDPVDEVEFSRLVVAVLEAASAMEGVRPTHHELLTAMGFLAAREWGAEMTVCEVGLGGRLDATNVWDGGLAAVVSVGLDHQLQLGNTIPEIAREKAAIIKGGDLAISGAGGEATAVVARAARGVGAELWQLGEGIRCSWSDPVPPGPRTLEVATPHRRLGGLELGIPGAIQGTNAALAVAIADGMQRLGLEVPDPAVRRGLAAASWPGRLQSLPGDPAVLIDAAHNPAAVAAVLPELRESLSRAGRGILLFGAMRDHDHRTMLAQLATLDVGAAVLTRASSARAVPPPELAGEWEGAAQPVEPARLALERARELAGHHGLVVCLGSIYLAGEVLAAAGQGLPPDPIGPLRPNW